jgi:hypothetical protein
MMSRWLKAQVSHYREGARGWEPKKAQVRPSALM